MTKKPYGMTPGTQKRTAIFSKTPYHTIRGHTDHRRHREVVFSHFGFDIERTMVIKEAEIDEQGIKHLRQRPPPRSAPTQKADTLSHLAAVSLKKKG